MEQFVYLQSSKIVVDIDNLAYILRVELNKYAIVPKRTVSPNIPVLDGAELEALIQALRVRGRLFDVVAPEAKPVELAKA